MRPIVFVGPMGAGKTTLGKKLAKELDRKFFDTDKLIEASHGSISKIFEVFGEAKFREYEEDALASSLVEGAVVSTGGGAVLSEKSRRLLKNATVIFLDTSKEAVLSRINLDKRPLLRDNPEKWQKIYEERLPLYTEVSNIRVFTGSRPIKDLLAEIQSKVQSYEL